MDGNFYHFFMQPLETLFLQEWRSDLLKNAYGNCLEIGFGTGANFKFYSNSINLTGIEPDLSMSKVANGKKRENIKLVEARSENLPFENNYFDTVITTLVLCSVEDPEKAISEIHRVLKPNGTFLLLEHVRHSNIYLANIQDFGTPLWSLFAGGCQLNRNQDENIKKFSFQIVENESLGNGIFKKWILKKN